MKIIRKYVCPVCMTKIEGTGDHIVRKLASTYAGQSLRGNIHNHIRSSKKCYDMFMYMKGEFDAYELILNDFID